MNVRHDVLASGFRRRKKQMTQDPKIIWTTTSLGNLRRICTTTPDYPTQARQQSLSTLDTADENTHYSPGLLVFFPPLWKSSPSPGGQLSLPSRTGACRPTLFHPPQILLSITAGVVDVVVQLVMIHQVVDDIL